MTEIFEDAFDIVHRIKAIDPKYRVFRNHLKHRYEVHREYGLNDRVELVWTELLDERLVRKVFMTRKENAEKLLKEIEKDNEQLQKQENAELFEKIMQDVKL